MTRDQIYRLLWWIASVFFFRFTPVVFHKLRISILNIFGANISYGCWVYPNVEIWSPRNLKMGQGSTLGPRVLCYNTGPIIIGKNTTVSQGVHLCTGTHDPDDKAILENPVMPLISLPITIGDYCWITTDVFIAPGVVIEDGVVVGARAVVLHNLTSWAIYGGYPATLIRNRPIHQK